MEADPENKTVTHGTLLEIETNILNDLRIAHGQNREHCHNRIVRCLIFKQTYCMNSIVKTENIAKTETQLPSLTVPYCMN